MGLSDNRFLELQRLYLTARKSTDAPMCQFLDFNDFRLADEAKYPFSRMRVVEDTKTGTNELLNWTNHFALSIADFKAWSAVLTSAKDKEERFSILVEIISPIAFQTLSFPAAIRGKLVFVCCKAIRDTYNVRRPNGKSLADHELTERVLREQLMLHPEICEMKDDFRSFLGKLSGIDGESFRQLTLNYRNRANHQITPCLEIGERFAFAPMEEDGIEGFTFGIEKAIIMSGLLTPLKEQHSQCYEALKGLWQIIQRFDACWVESF